MVPGNHTYPKWVQALSIPAILSMVLLFTTCQEHAVLASFSAQDIFAVAFPADISPVDVGNTFVKHGIDSIINENSLLVPMTDFVSLGYLSLSELSRRVQADDPRHTPLSFLLLSSFLTNGADGPWRIWYVPIASSSVYKAIQNAFLEIGSDWAWDAQLPSPILRFLWVIWFGWTLWLLLSKQVKDRSYHVVLIFAWLPLVFFQSLPAAGLMVVGQGVSAILGMTAIANGRWQGMTRKQSRRLLGNLAPFLLSMLVLVAIDMALLLPMAISTVVLILLLVYKASVLNLLNKRRMHPYPPFRQILEETIKVKVGWLGLWAIIPLGLMAIILLSVPYTIDEGTAYRLAFKLDTDKSVFAPDYTSLIRSHTIYQEALAWGRLGDASWMVDSYSRPYRFEIQDDIIVRGEMDRSKAADGFQNSAELDKEMKRILEHTRGGAPMVVSGDDIPARRAIQLDSLGVIFYIMALAPFCVLGLQRVSQSRRKTSTSYTNRQVA